MEKQSGLTLTKAEEQAIEDFINEIEDMKADERFKNTSIGSCATDRDSWRYGWRKILK
jgi:hypothetical protein